MSPSPEDLRNAIDSAIGELDCSSDAASCSIDDIAMFIFRVETDGMTNAHLRRVHNRLLAVLTDEFGMDPFEDA